MIYSCPLFEGDQTKPHPLLFDTASGFNQYSCVDNPLFDCYDTPSEDDDLIKSSQIHHNIHVTPIRMWVDQDLPGPSSLAIIEEANFPLVALPSLSTRSSHHLSVIMIRDLISSSFQPAQEGYLLLL